MWCRCWCSVGWIEAGYEYILVWYCFASFFFLRQDLYSAWNGWTVGRTVEASFLHTFAFYFLAVLISQLFLQGPKKAVESFFLGHFFIRPLDFWECVPIGVVWSPDHVPEVRFSVRPLIRSRQKFLFGRKPPYSTILQPKKLQQINRLTMFGSFYGLKCSWRWSHFCLIFNTFTLQKVGNWWKARACLKGSTYFLPRLYFLNYL